MRYYPKLDVYKSNNVKFHPASHQATSYDWWCFVKLIKGQLIFNAYRYSNTTAGHQSAVRTLLRELGIEIDRVVEVPEGLQNVRTIGELTRLENAWLKRREELKTEKRLRRNARARERRALVRQASEVAS